MCGLAFIMSKKGQPAGHHVLNLYKAQASRGRQGFGYLGIKRGKLISVKRATSESSIEHELNREKAEIILFHHRLPTSTKNTLGTTHPIFVSHKELKNDYYFAHNGVITNDDELKLKHEELGYVYTTEFTEKVIANYKNGRTEILNTENSVFNDSETLAIELARYIEGLSEKVNTKGSAAFWGVSLKKDTKEVIEIFFGKNKGRDLKIFENKKWIGFSSETGNDLADMKLFSYEVNDKNRILYERELKIDESTPVVTRSVSIWHKPAGYDISRTEPKDDERTVFYSGEKELQNAYYTLNEVLQTNVPLHRFFETTFAGAKMYVPEIYKGENIHNRTLYDPNYIKLPVPEPDAKAMERLEELAIEFAKLDSQIYYWDKWLSENKVTETAHRRKIDDLDMKMQLLEEEMSSLGIDESIVEDKIDDAKQLEDYNNSFSSIDDEYNLPLQIS